MTIDMCFSFRRQSRPLMFMLCIFWKILVIGTIETAAVNTYYAREHEDTQLWPEKTTNITDDVASRTWRKDGNLIAWLNENGFYKDAGYEDRLKYVGNGSITIKGASQNDSGSYTQMIKVQGVNETLESDINLQVIGSLANVCTPVITPVITPNGFDLRADLPQEAVCNNSALVLEWKDAKDKSVTHQNGTAILHLGTNSGGEYTVCAVGEATKYFQGNMSDFCTSYTGSLANVCTPVITRDGSNLRADLPQEAVCINSALGLEWKDAKDKSVTHQNGTAILHLGTNSGGEYTVCAVGEATKYFQGNMSDFCTSYTVSEYQESRDQVNLNLQVVLPCVLVPVIALVIAEIICYCKNKREFFQWIFAKCKGWICQKSSKNKEDQMEQGISLVEPVLSEKLPTQATTNRDADLNGIDFKSRNA